MKLTATPNTRRAAITKDNNETPENDKIIDIQNSTGSLLPSTVGRGAIAFSGVSLLSFVIVHSVSLVFLIVTLTGADSLL